MTYAEQVRADIAARYGVKACCQVQIIPQGVMALLEDAPEPMKAAQAK